MDRALFIIFFTFRSHQRCKTSVQKEKRDLKKRADARWVMTYSHKTQSFMKNGGQPESLGKALKLKKSGVFPF